MHRNTTKTITAATAVWALAVPPVSAWGAVQSATATIPKGAVTISGPAVACKRWGKLQVRITAKKTVVTVAGRKRVRIKIYAISVPVRPTYTAKTRYINKQALPLLIEEALSIQNPYVEVISGATDTTDSFTQSLQAALLKAQKLPGS